MTPDGDRPARWRTPGLLATAEGSRPEAFAIVDWAMLLGVAGAWGGTFLLTAIALDHFEPGLTLTLRLGFSAATLLVFPPARRRIARGDWPPILLLGVIWMAMAYGLQISAQTRIDSALTGMLMGTSPLWAALFAALLLRRRPGRVQVAGLVLGFAGLTLMVAPSAVEASATALGVGMVVVAAMSFALSTNLVIPLQRTYGALAVIAWAQMVGLVITLPWGILDGSGSEWDLGALLAVGVMGSVQTGLAVVVLSILVGRVGAARGGVTMYLVPAVAIVLGVLLRDESVKTLALLGVGLALVGAYVTTRADTRRASRVVPARPAETLPAEAGETPGC